MIRKTVRNKALEITYNILTHSTNKVAFNGGRCVCVRGWGSHLLCLSAL